MNTSRIGAFLIIIGIYLLSLIAGFLGYYYLLSSHNELWFFILRLFIADLIATAVVYIFSLVLKNSSMYDPYWSVIPWIIFIFAVIMKNNFNLLNILIILIFGFWSNRLTINWAWGFRSLQSQDWRYIAYKENNKPLLWHFLNLVGIHYMPTILVFMGLTPLLVLVYQQVTFSYWHIIGLTIIVLATIIELLADLELSKFKANPLNKGQVINRGLWKYSRHPNYLGEITIWFGCFLIMVISLPQFYYLGIGALLILALFVFVSIPLMEKRQLANKIDYAKYRSCTSMLLLLPPKKSKNNPKESSEL
ncbi:MAG: DUF1295 domain-containing protein [Acholeplasmatales bacterium]|jgi:steroid 5-alpha reductase family enzyme|nr:DUF1295 domain-containing protein [Acholeplasmatales bacterium]